MNNRKLLGLCCRLGFVLAIVAATNTGGTPAWAGLSGMSDGDPPQVVAATAAAPAAVPKAQTAAPAQVTPEKPAAAEAQQTTPNYDGRWVVRSSPGCLLSASSIATVSHGRIRGPGYSGTISPDGTVHSSGRGLPLITFVSSGHTTETQGSGTFHESDGCTGTWSSHKL